GVHVLDGDNTVIEGIGFAGIKGFGGGFGRFSINPAGEPRLREFVAEAVDQALRLEDALRTLTTDEKVVLMHYAPIPATIRGEPREFYPLLGSSRFLPPLETYDTSVVFHGHAHYGTPHGRTPGGIDVYNVALPLLQRNGETVRRWTGRAPERRTPGGGRADGSTECGDRRRALRSLSHPAAPLDRAPAPSAARARVDADRAGLQPRARARDRVALRHRERLHRNARLARRGERALGAGDLHRRGLRHLARVERAAGARRRAGLAAAAHTGRRARPHTRGRRDPRAPPDPRPPARGDLAGMATPGRERADHTRRGAPARLARRPAPPPPDR